MVSAERLIAYGKFPSEASLDTILPLNKPSKDWPHKGVIKMEGLKFRYKKTGPYVLKEITCKIEAAEKVRHCFLGLATYNVKFTYIPNPNEMMLVISSSYNNMYNYNEHVVYLVYTYDVHMRLMFALGCCSLCRLVLSVGVVLGSHLY